MTLPYNGFIQPVEIVVASTLPRNGYIQPVEVLAGPGVVTGSGAAGQVAYWDGATSITGNAGMTYVAGTATLSAGSLTLTAAGTLAWSTDLFLRRGAANTLSQSNGANPQFFHLYGTTDSDTAPANYDRLNIRYSSGDGEYMITNQEAGTGSDRALTLGCQTTTGVLIFMTNSTRRWKVDASGHLLAVADNTYDIGASGATRPRTIYAGTSFSGSNGTSSNPSFTFSSTPTLGMWLDAAGGRISLVGTNSLDLSRNSGNNYFRATYSSSFGGSGTELHFNSATGTSFDTAICRIAAATLAQVNGTTAQEYRIYGTTTGPKYLSLAHNGTNAEIATSGTGSLILKATGAGSTLDIYTVNTLRGYFDANGHYLAGSDNAYDWGGASNRIRSGYFGTSISIGTNPAATGLVRLGNAGYVYGRNAANSADVHCIGITSGDRVLIGSGTDVQWGPPLVALGGGAAPTFGTIGGSGPAAAAQNAWMRIVDSTGAAFWVPTWK